MLLKLLLANLVMYIYIRNYMYGEVSAVKYRLNAEGILDPSCVAPLVQVNSDLGLFLHSIV